MRSRSPDWPAEHQVIYGCGNLTIEHRLVWIPSYLGTTGGQKFQHYELVRNRTISEINYDMQQWYCGKTISGRFEVFVNQYRTK